MFPLSYNVTTWLKSYLPGELLDTNFSKTVECHYENKSHKALKTHPRSSMRQACITMITLGVKNFTLPFLFFYIKDTLVIIIGTQEAHITHMHNKIKFCGKYNKKSMGQPVGRI